MNNDELFRQYVLDYDIDVPEEKIKNEYDFIVLDMKHRMQYDTLTTGTRHPDVQGELEAQKEEIMKAAIFEAKSNLVLKDVIKKQNFTVTPDDLQAKAQSMIEKEHTTMEMIKRFFGDDLSGLSSDILKEKAYDWILGQTNGSI